MRDNCHYLRAKIDCVNSCIELQKFIFNKFTQYREGLISKTELENLVRTRTKFAEQMFSRIIGSMID